MRPLDPHLDEGTAHAWLDGALAPDEAARVEAHLAGCPACEALVAEAQGLLAGASRILGALDAVPGDVVPRDPAREAARDAALSAALAAAAADRRAPARRAWLAGVPLRAAAALLVVAGLGAAVVRLGGGAREMSADVAATSTAGAPAAESVEALDERFERLAEADSSASAPSASAARAAPGAAGRPRMPARAPAMAPMVPPTVPSTVPPRDLALQRQAVVDPALDSGAGSGAGAPVAGVIAGRVRAPDGRPVAAASVELVGRAQGTVTDDSGRFLLRDVAPGAATVRALRPGFEARAEAVVVGTADTTRAAVVLRPSELALSSAVASKATAQAPLPAPPPPASMAGAAGTYSGRALAGGARPDSAAAADAGARRLDAAADAALRARAARLHAAVGCYLVTPAAGGPLTRPTRVALDDAGTARRAGRQSYAARLLPDGASAEWTPLAGDSLRVGWTTASGGIVLRLAPPAADGSPPDVRRGDARSVAANGAAGPAQPVTARRTPCEPGPLR